MHVQRICTEIDWNTTENEWINEQLNKRMNKYINKYNYKWINNWIDILSCARGAKVGGLGGLQPPPPPELAVDKLGGGGGSPPPDFERISWKIDHICYFVQVISIGGGGGDWLPLNWSNYIVNVFSSA